MYGWFDLNHFSWAGSDPERLTSTQLAAGQSVAHKFFLEAQAAILLL